MPFCRGDPLHADAPRDLRSRDNLTNVPLCVLGNVKQQTDQCGGHARTAACSDPVAPLLWFDRIETPAVPTGRLALTSLNYGVDVFDMIAGSFEPVSDERSNCVSWHPDGEQMLLQNLVIVRLTGERARIPT